MKSVKTYLTQNHPDKVEEFEKGAQAYAKKIVSNFKDFDCVSHIYICWLACYLWRISQYTGENMNPEGMVALLNYRVRNIAILCGLLD